MLRPYQKETVDNARLSLRNNRSILLQAPTGTGKTIIVSSITSTASERQFRTWFIVPRRELSQQASRHFTKWGIIHNFIDANHKESRAYNTHIVSKDTLTRRWGKIKNWPNLIIIDEAHINYKFQIKLKEEAPDYCKIIGLSATPERLDGLGLDDIYDDIIYSHSIPWFMHEGYLSPLRYFAPPVEGIEKLHYRGTEIDANELEELLKKKAVYGEVIGHYEKWGSIKKRTVSTQAGITHENNNFNRGKPALFFLRTVQAAYDMAERFQSRGYKFFCIEGNMKNSERRNLIRALTAGEIDGLTSCEILTYGFDCPRVEYGASLRPTASRALYFQMVGRMLRPFTDYETGYKKEEALFFDHANLLSMHYELDRPGVPLFYLDDITWNFSGREKRKKMEKPPIMRQCPFLDYMYCEKKTCTGCPHHPQGQFNFQEKQEQKIIEVELKEAEKPKSMQDRPPEERREFYEEINDCITDYVEGINQGEIRPGPIEELIRIAKKLDRRIMWVYFVLNEKTCTPEERQNGRKAINIPLLHAIARIERFKPGWVYYKRKELEKRRAG